MEVKSPAPYAPPQDLPWDPFWASGLVPILATKTIGNLTGNTCMNFFMNFCKDFFWPFIS